MKKQRQSKVAKAELRAGGGLHGPEKTAWSTGSMAKLPGNKLRTTAQWRCKTEWTTNITKISLEVLSSKVPSLGVFIGSHEKEVLLIYLILFCIKRWWLFWRFYWYTQKTSKKGIISVSVFNLASAIIKWIQERVDKTSDETINKTYAAYKTMWTELKG